MSKSSVTIVGSEAPRFIEFLVGALVNIESIKLFSPPSSPALQEDSSINDREKALIERGLAIRDELGLPFWDSLLLHLSTHPDAAPNVLHIVAAPVHAGEIYPKADRRQPSSPQARKAT